MGWNEFLTMRFDRIDWPDPYEKTHHPAQLRRKIAYHAVMSLLMPPAVLLLLDYYYSRDFSLASFPVLVMFWLIFGGHYHDYRLRKKELAGGEITRADKLSRLRWRVAPFFGLILSVIVVFVVSPLWAFLRIGYVTPEGFILSLVMVAVLSVVLYALWLDLTRLKKRLEATGTVENSLP